MFFMLLLFFFFFQLSQTLDISPSLLLTAPVCNYLSLQNTASKSPILCPFYLGTISYNNQPFYLCPSNTLNSVNLYTFNQSLNATYNFEKNRTIESGDQCIQLLSDNANTLICSNNNSLISWDIPSGNLTGVYNESYWSRIPDFQAISESFSSMIVMEDGLVVKLIDIIKNQELQVFGEGTSFTRSIVMKTSSFLGIHYNYVGNQMIEIWDLSTVVNKFSWDVDLNFSMPILQSQKNYIIGFKNNVLSKWDFLLSQNSSVTLSTNNISEIRGVNGNDGQTKNILILIENEAFILYDSISSVIDSTIEKNPNPNIDLIIGSYNQFNGLLLLKSNNYFLYNISSLQLFKMMDLDSNIEILTIYWNFTTNDEFFLLYQQDSFIFLENWNISTCQPLDVIKDPLISFKSLVQVPGQNESHLLLINQDNTLSLYSPYSNAIIQSFPGMNNAIFTSLLTISCPHNNLILINGYLELASGNQYSLFFLDMNTSEISTALYKSFTSPINSLIYLNYRDLIAFENGGIIYVFDIINQNLINSFPHNQNGFTEIISLENYPYIVVSAVGNSMRFWNIHVGSSSVRFLTNYTETDISIQIFQSMNLMNYKTIEILMGSYQKSTNRIINFWNISGGSLIFQLVDSRALSLNYLNMFHFSIETVDYLIVITNITNDLWNLNTQTLERTFYLPKLQNTLLAFQSSETLILDISNNTIALWAYDLVTYNIQENYYFCKQGYFLDNLTNSCDQCNDLCYSNCFGPQYEECVPPQCNFLFEKSASVQDSQCFDCSLDNYFLEGNKKCITVSNFFTDYNLKTFCFGCLDGFYFSNNLCLPCSANCQICYGSSRDQCLTCETDYISFNSNCYKINSEDSEFPLMIVFAIIFGFIVLLIVFYVLKWLYEGRCFCIVWKQLWRCLNALFFDDKFTSTIHRKTIILPPLSYTADHSQSNGLMNLNHQEVELMFPSNTARSATIRTPLGMGNGMDHYNLLINAVNRLKGKMMETNELTKPTALRLANFFVAEIKEEIPFFLYELIDSEQEFNKNNYFQIKIIKKLCDSAYGPIFLGEKLCKTRFTIKIFFDNVEELTIKKINKFLFFLNEQDKIKYNTFSKILPINALVYTSTKSNFCLGVMEEKYDYNLDDFLSKFAKTIHFIQKLDVTLQILDSVKSLHDLNISHRNIKANNIVINSEDVNYSVNLKINDFSKYMKLSTMLYSSKSPQCNLFQLAYIPPEYFNKKNYVAGSKNSDIWSLGVLIYDIFYPDTSHSLDLPWITFAEEMTEKYKKAGALMKLNEQLEQELEKEMNYCREDPAIRAEITDVINSCLKAKPEKRIPINELIWKIQWIKVKVTKE